MIKNAKKKKGFTLVELIAVIAILGILAAVIVPRVGNFTTQANTTRTKSNAAIILNAIEIYNSQVSTNDKRIGNSSSNSLSNPKITELINDNTTSGALDSTAGPDLKATISKLDATNDADKIVLSSTYLGLSSVVKTGLVSTDTTQ